jgi:hypothetical protein
MEWNKFGTSFFMTETPPEDVFKPLPAGIYTVKVTQQGVYFLDRLFEKFDLPEKFYGDVFEKTKRVLGTYSDRQTSTGVLFVGEKGSGKSLTSKYICNSLVDINIPTIIISNAFGNSKFCEFIKNIDQDCVILIDEFEKLYPHKSYDSSDIDCEPDSSDSNSSQNGLLSLFDGVFSSRKLFILTANNRHKISPYLLNRPGRLYYLFEYSGLTSEFVEDYCQDKLVNKSHMTKILAITSLFESFTFDMLQGLVEEMNRFDIPPEEAIEGMNIIRQPQTNSFTSDFEYNGIKSPMFEYDDYYRHILTRNISLNIFEHDLFIYKETQKFRDKGSKGLGSPDLVELNYLINQRKTYSEFGISAEIDGVTSAGNFEYITHFLRTDLKTIDGKKGVYVYVNESGAKLVLTKTQNLDAFNYSFSGL